MELVFEILRKVVNSNHEDIYCEQLEIDGYDEETVGYHLYLMHQAGLLKAGIQKTSMGPMFERTTFIEMKWEGYEFLDALKNDTVLEKFKKVLEEKGKNIPFSIARDLLMKISASYFIGTN